MQIKQKEYNVLISGLWRRIFELWQSQAHCFPSTGKLYFIQKHHILLDPIVNLYKGTVNYMWSIHN